MELQGTIEEIIYSNDINGYAICVLRHDKGMTTIVGYMPFINVGECLKVSGKTVMHPEYGEQLKVDLYEKQLPETADALEIYLASGVIKGVGPVTAARIVERFGDEALNILQFHPQRLSEIRGITLDKASRIGQAFQEQKDLREVVMFFQKYGISPSFSTKIYRVFGGSTIEKVKENPYKLADELFGIGFKTADKIARSLGVDLESKYRICSGIKHVLGQAAGAGHTFLPENRLKELTSQLLEVPLEDIRDVLVSLVMDKSIIIDQQTGDSRLYLSPYYNAELGVCKRLIELTCSVSSKRAKISEMIEAYQSKEGIELAPDQKKAVEEAITSGALVITGGPGTGKTTIIKCIIQLLRSEGCEIVLTAPTGRAAKRMSEATGFEAKTIHRLLEIGYMGESSELVFARNEENTLEAQAVIVDEMSMVDVLLMNHLLKALAPGTRLIMVGDANQLPSVGAGNVLKDIINSGLMKTVKLVEVFRQAAESMIVTNAHRINRGETPVLNMKDRDFFFMARPNAESVLAAVVDLCVRRLPETYKYDPMKNIQVLTPMRKGPVGVSSLNTELQKVLNPARKGAAEKVFRDFIFRKGDKVMQIKNNYNTHWVKATGSETDGLGVFNGDTGIISQIDDEEQKLTVLFDDDKLVDYDFGMLDELEPAYAVTIHKSQGSEFPAVIIPVFQGPQVLMTRNLLYTAITRARSLVVLVGSENTLAEMVTNDREALRYSGLTDLMKRSISGYA